MDMRMRRSGPAGPGGGDASSAPRPTTPAFVACPAGERARKKSRVRGWVLAVVLLGGLAFAAWYFPERRDALVHRVRTALADQLPRGGWIPRFITRIMAPSAPTSSPPGVSESDSPSLRASLEWARRAKEEQDRRAAETDAVAGGGYGDAPTGAAVTTGSGRREAGGESKVTAIITRPDGTCEAVLGGRVVKVGDQVGDLKVEAITAREVTVSEDGRTRVLTVGRPPAP